MHGNDRMGSAPLTLIINRITTILIHSMSLTETQSNNENTPQIGKGYFMGKIALLPCDINSRGIYLENRVLPVNYMEDFTLMGFIVDCYQEALTLLTNNSYQLVEQKGGADIYIDTPQDLQKIKALLRANNICCDFSDIADSIYQA